MFFRARELLGEENYQKYNQYNSALGVFPEDPITQFEELLEPGEELEIFQEEQLIVAMAEEFEEFLLSTVPDLKGPPGFRVGMRDEDIGSKIAENLDSLQERYLIRAESILTESQMERFEKSIENQIKGRKLLYNQKKTGNF